VLTVFVRVGDGTVFVRVGVFVRVRVEVGTVFVQVGVILRVGVRVRVEVIVGVEVTYVLVGWSVPAEGTR
jgi:hypothetical protein